MPLVNWSDAMMNVHNCSNRFFLEVWFSVSKPWAKQSMWLKTQWLALHGFHIHMWGKHGTLGEWIPKSINLSPRFSPVLLVNFLIIALRRSFRCFSCGLNKCLCGHVRCTRDFGSICFGFCLNPNDVLSTIRATQWGCATFCCNFCNLSLFGFGGLYLLVKLAPSNVGETSVFCHVFAHKSALLHDRFWMCTLMLWKW